VTTIAQVFEHFEGKDWVTLVASLIAIMVSVVAVLHNRRANQMNEISSPAHFTATWHEHKDDRPVHVLRLVNSGDGIADRVTVTLPYDPNHILGLSGTIRELLKPGDAAMFLLSRMSLFKTESAMSKYNLVVEWFDVWGKPRTQRISAQNVRWGDETSTDAPGHAHPEIVDESSGLYDLAPWITRVFKRPTWKRRRKHRPRQDFR
jgi:hypothetical protein